MFGAWLNTLTEAATSTTVVATTQMKLTDYSMPMKGLLTTLFGLAGVFLVLLLFFVAIKLMQRLGKKELTHE